MSKPGSNLQAELERFRKNALAAGKLKADAAKDREAKLKKQQAAGVKKPAAPRQPRRAKSTVSNAATTSGGAGASSGDWKTQRQEPLLVVGMRQKQVLELLRDKEAPLSVEDIKAALPHINIDAQKDLRDALEANPKIGIDDEGNYFYRPDAHIRNKAQLLEYVRKSGAYIAVSEIQDAYKTVAADIRSLKEEGLIIGLHSFDPELQCEILYPVDMKLSDMTKVDVDIATLWAQIDIPDDDEGLKLELEKIGVKPTARKAPRKAKLDKDERKKRRKQQRLRTITNVHLAHLLEGEGPAGIDS